MRREKRENYRGKRNYRYRLWVSVLLSGCLLAAWLLALLLILSTTAKAVL